MISAERVQQHLNDPGQCPLCGADFEDFRFDESSADMVFFNASCVNGHTWVEQFHIFAISADFVREDQEMGIGDVAGEYELLGIQQPRTAEPDRTTYVEGGTPDSSSSKED